MGFQDGIVKVVGTEVGKAEEDDAGALKDLLSTCNLAFALYHELHI